MVGMIFILQFRWEIIFLKNWFYLSKRKRKLIFVSDFGDHR